MIAGMADGGRVLNEQKYKDAAARAAQFILQNMRGADGGLLRSHRAGQVRIDGFLEDYALMIRGLIALHKATGDRRVLEDARKLAQLAKARFWDDSAGGYFDTLQGQPDLFVRVKSVHDGAVPCGNSTMLHNLLDLHELTGQVPYLDDATAALKSMSSAIGEHPTSSALAAMALDRVVKRYPKRLDQTQTAATKPAPVIGRSELVQITTNPIEIQVKPGAPATFEISLQIDRRYHINAHQPGDDFLIPLKVNLTGCDGLKLVVDYPRGEQFKSEIAEGTLYMHKGALVLTVRVEQTGKFTGQPRVTLTYQACTDKECLEPKTQVVGVRIIAQR
jgi:hypothetical protein